jgi:hypothetical protein
MPSQRNESTGGCYLLHVNLGSKPSKARISEAATQIKSIISEISPDHRLAYTSGDGSTFGFFLKSSLTASQICHRVNSPGGDNDRGKVIASPLRHEDSVLALEIGDDVSGIGKTRVQAWFQHRRPTTNRASKPQAASDAATSPSQLADQLAKIKDKLGK